MKNQRKLIDVNWKAVQAEMRQLIIEAAKARQLITYSELSRMLQTAYVHYHSHVMTRLLIDIGSEEAKAGRPTLPALVIAKQTGRPGPGYFRLAPGGEETTDPIREWEEEVQRVYDYWSKH
jgi:hypothetical protein